MNFTDGIYLYLRNDMTIRDHLPNHYSSQVAMKLCLIPLILKISLLGSGNN